MSTIYPIRYSFSGADCRAYGFFDEGVIEKVKKNEINLNLFEEEDDDAWYTIGAKRIANVGADFVTRNVKGIINNAAYLTTGNDSTDFVKAGIQKGIDWYEEEGEGKRKIKHNVVLLDSLATISLSIHESKSPVRRLGHMAPSGYTRAIRTIAGSMVLTIIGSDHPLKNLSEQDPKSVVYFSNDLKNSFNIVTKMSPFNLMLLYKTELPNTSGSKMVIKGIDFINEGIVTSVNDLVSEVVLQFVALDIEQFESDNYL